MPSRRLDQSATENHHAWEVKVENKGHTLSVHYRQARNPEAEVVRIRSLSHKLAGARIVGGHAVLNVLPQESPGKEGAIRALRLRFPGRPLLFVGDDDVDEDAFRSPFVTWSVRIGRMSSSDAFYFLETQRDVDRPFQALLEVRTEASGGWWASLPERLAEGGSA